MWLAEENGQSCYAALNGPILISVSGHQHTVVYVGQVACPGEEFRGTGWELKSIAGGTQGVDKHTSNNVTFERHVQWVSGFHYQDVAPPLGLILFMLQQHMFHRIEITVLSKRQFEYNKKSYLDTEQAITPCLAGLAQSVERRTLNQGSGYGYILWSWVQAPRSVIIRFFAEITGSRYLDTSPGISYAFSCALSNFSISS